MLEVSSFGSYMFNSISNADVSAMIMADLYPVSYTKDNDKSHRFEINLDSEPFNGNDKLVEKIVVSVFKDMVGVSVKNGTSDTFGTSVGLMGSFSTGDMLARDGITVLDDPIAFGIEWQGE